jgi:REP element-mobilizing transposase RayT
VAEEWQRTPVVRPYVRLGAWMVMPNHVHGLLGLTSETPRDRASADDDGATLQAHSLGAIVGQVESVCTKRIRRVARPDFAWQARFYDRVVRNERERRDTRRYILDNPLKWADDRNHPANH